MDEKPKAESIQTLTDGELHRLISEQDTSLASLSITEHEAYSQQKSKYTLSNNVVSLAYFGAEHIHDPSHTQYLAIDDTFNSFLKSHNSAKIAVLVEGSIPAVTQDISHDIHATGERGFITHMAKNRGVEVRCLEPDLLDEMRFLLQEFPPEEIEYYYYLRAVRGYFRQGRIQGSASFEEYSSQILGMHRRLYEELDEFRVFDFTLEHMKEIHFNITGANFDQNRRLDINPRNSNTVINKISKASSTYRDFFHVRAIERELREGISVFIVNGRDHAIVQRPALEEMFS